MTLADLRSDDVAINHLKVIAPPGTADQVQRELALASWPRAPGRSWIFIREVHAKATGTRMAKALSEQTRSLIDRSSSPVDNGLVMRFDNFESLLVGLINDLAHGRASQQWYWQRWSYLFSLPIAKALAEVMEAHIDYLPAVTAGLAQINGLSFVWQCLGNAEALRLAAIIARRNSIDLQAGIQNATEEKPAFDRVGLPAVQYDRWEMTLKMFARQDPRRILALLLISQENFPLYLQDAPHQLIGVLNSAFSASEQQTDNPLPPKKIVPREIAKPFVNPVNPDSRFRSFPPPQPPVESKYSDTLHQSDLSAQIPETHEREDKALPTADLPSHARSKSSTSDAVSSLAASNIYEVETQQSEISIITEKDDDASLPTVPKDSTPSDKIGHNIREQIRLEDLALTKPSDSFHTAQGGLFFLLNFLKREDVLNLIRKRQCDTDEANGFAGGWGWLYRLGRELALDETDPITTFLAQQLGFQSTAQLPTLPPLPAREQLLNLARHLYGRVGLWHSDLLKLNATVHFTPSHVDLYAPLNSVRLPVRLSGLDLNPGWLPWLARVVMFHYES